MTEGKCLKVFPCCTGVTAFSASDSRPPRDWSSITKGRELQNGEIVGTKLFLRPPFQYG